MIILATRPRISGWNVSAIAELFGWDRTDATDRTVTYVRGDVTVVTMYDADDDLYSAVITTGGVTKPVTFDRVVILSAITAV